MKHLRYILLVGLMMSPAAAQTVKTLGYNAANGQVIANTGTNTLTFTNAIGFGDAAQTRTNLGLGSAATNAASAFQATSAALDTLSSNNAANLTNFPTLNQNTTGTAANVTGVVAIINGGTGATNEAGVRANLSLGTAATNDASAFQPASANLTTLASNNAANLTNFPSSVLLTNGSAAGLTNFPTLNQNTTGTASNVTGTVAVANGGTGATNAAGARTNLGSTTVGNAVFTATNAAAAAAAIGLGATNSVTFSNVTTTGTLTVKSLATTDPVSWALDAVQIAADTNGVIGLPDAANILRVTNANTISAVTNGRLGAFYFLINQSGTNLVISNSATITARGATNLTLGANQSATLISTTATNATVH